jgi:ketosteroid isomerase-like protein
MTKIQLAGAAIAGLMVASLGGCTPPKAATPAPDTGKIADTVKSNTAQLVAAFNAHDLAKAVSFDAPDAVLMGHGQPDIIGPDADLAASKKGLADDPSQHVSIANESVDVAASGDMAIYRATYTFNFTDPKTKQPTSETGHVIGGWKPQADGSWKIAWQVVSNLPAAAATKT